MNWPQILYTIYFKPNNYPSLLQISLWRTITWICASLFILATIKGSIATDRFFLEHWPQAERSFKLIKEHYPQDLIINWQDKKLISNHSWSIPNPDWIRELGITHPYLISYQKKQPDQDSAKANKQESLRLDDEKISNNQKESSGSFIILNESQASFVMGENNYRVISLDQIIATEDFEININTKDAFIEDLTEKIKYNLTASVTIRFLYGFLIALPTMILGTILNTLIFVSINFFFKTSNFSFLQSILLSFWISIYAHTIQAIVFLTQTSTSAQSLRWFDISYWLALALVIYFRQNSQAKQ